MDMPDVKKVKNTFDVRVNDVVMALCAGALRGFLADRAELPDKPLIAAVPSSVHGQTDRPGRNQLSGMFCNLHTDIEDPLDRLHAIAASNVRAKEHSASSVRRCWWTWRRAFPRCVRCAARAVVPDTADRHGDPQRRHLECGGSHETLYSAGAEVTALYPIGPIFHGSGLEHHGDVARR